MTLIDTATEMVERLGYAGLALCMLAVAPELLMPFAGFLSQQTELGLPGVVIAGSVGGTLGSSILYLAAHRFGELRLRHFMRHSGRLVLFRESDLDVVLAIYRRHGDMLVLVGRFVPTVRSLVSLPAGLLPMPFPRFLLFTLAGTSLWCTALAIGGYLMGAKWQVLEAWLGLYGAGVLTLGITLLGWFAMRRLREHVMGKGRRGRA